MPFKSKAQERWAFSKDGLGKKKAEEWAKETTNKNLPEKKGLVSGLRKS